MLSTLEPKLPTLEELRKLTISDLALMSRLAVILKERLRKYIDIDPYTTSDPVGPNDDYIYSIILDKRNSVRVVSIMATGKGALPQLPWNDILQDTFVRLPISKEDASRIKYELMPKDTNNFYGYRRSSIVAGFVMFASQICGLH
jgi:hypothetical protein